MRILFLTLASLSIVSHQASAQSIQVTTKPLNQVLVDRQLSANASVMAVNDSAISAEITAIVESIHVDTGDEVKSGDVLIQLDATDYQLQLEQAQANLQAAKARRMQAELRLNRARELSENQYISSDDLLARETDLAVQKAEYQRFLVAMKSAKRQLEKTQIKASFDGVVTNRMAQKGQLLNPGMVTLHLTQTQAAEVHASIPSQLVETLNRAESMQFKSQHHQALNVKVLRVSPVIEQNSSVQKVRFQFEDSSAAIGQNGQLIWTLKGSMLSADMVVKREGKLGVFVLNGDIAKFQPLPTAQEGRPVPLDPSENWQVIVGGREKLQHGVTVRVK